MNCNKTSVYIVLKLSCT